MIYDVTGNQALQAYDKDGTTLLSVYDIDGQPIMLIDGVQINLDSSTGTDSGYALSSGLTGENYVLRLMIDSRSGQSLEMQSCIYDSDNHYYYVFTGGWYVGKYDSSYQYVETITLPQSAGHNNDGFYYNGKIYLTNSKTSLYVWTIANNTITTLSISGISDPSNGSTRSADALCSDGNGNAYIGCRDVYTSDIEHQADDKLSIYSVNLTTGVCTLEAELPWNCVYLQGMAALNGIMYCACNTQTTEAASNYKGITVKVIRTDTWELIDELICAGSFEPEGMDVVPGDGTQQLEVGIASAYSISKVVRFTAPYALMA